MSPLPRAVPGAHNLPPDPTCDLPGNPADEAGRLARAISEAGMAGVAAVFLQVGKPLAWAAGQALWVFQPFLDGVLPRGGARAGQNLSVGNIARFLEQEGSVDELISRLQPARGRER